MKRTTAGADGPRGVLTVAVLTGDPADVSARFGPALESAGLIVAADLGRLHRLAGALGVTLTGRVVKCAEEAEAGGGRCEPASTLAAEPVAALAAEPVAALAAEPAGAVVAELVAALLAGQDVLLVTDAAVCGDRLVAAAAEAGIRVTLLPGPSQIVTALVVSGLPGDRFVVEGFPSGSPEGRERRFAELAAERRTLIFNGSRSNLGELLAGLAGALGADRRATVCRQLAVSHTDVVRGTLGGLAGSVIDAGAAGQVTLVVAGAPAAESAVGLAGLADAVAQVRERVQGGSTTRDAVAAVAAATGLRKRDLYNAATQAARRADSR